jgi:cAMP-dependent protein kinase regulator
MAAVKLSPKTRELKEKADFAFTAQKWAKALDLYRKFDQEAPNDPRALQRIADLQRRFGDETDSVETYKRVVTIYTDQGFWAKAIAMNKIILEIDPKDLEVQKKLARMMSMQSNPGSVTDPGFRKAPASEILDTAIESASISISGATPLTYSDPAHDGAIGNLVDLDPEEPISKAPPGVSYGSSGSDLELLGTPQVGLQGIPLFSDMSVEEFHAVIDRLAVRLFPPGALVCEEGDLGRSMFIVAEGFLEVFTKEADGSRLVLGHLKGGEFFGEFGLLTNGQRNASVQATTPVELLEITSADFEIIAGKHPRVFGILEDYVRRRMLNNILTKSPVFRALTVTERTNLIRLLKPWNVKMGEVITPQGSAGDEMYFIKSGSVAVVVAQETGEKIQVGELGCGDYFGEVAMLTGKPRTATVSAKTDCQLFELKRKDAALVLRGNREILLRLRDKMNERAKDTIEAFRSYTESRTTLSLV